MENNDETTRWNAVEDLETRRLRRWLAGAWSFLRTLAAPRHRQARRGQAGHGFRPSAGPRPIDRLTTADQPHERPWLARGERSGAWLILAPGVRPYHVDSARVELDESSYDVLRPVKPTWYRRLEPFGALTALAPGALGFVVVHAVTGNLPGSLAAALLSGWVGGAVLTGVLETVARHRAQHTAASQAEQAMTQYGGLLRPLQPPNLRLLTDLLDRHSVDETRLHHLAFHAAGTDADADRAAAELELLARSQPVG